MAFGEYLAITGGIKLLERFLGPKLDKWSGKEAYEEKIRAEDRQFKIDLQDRAHLDRKELVEIQFLLNRNEQDRKIFFERCFPLENPYELVINNSLLLDDSGAIRLKTIQSNGKDIVPCRIISSLKETDHSYASTINASLSSYISTFFSANSERAVVSDIGAWKQNIPADDTYINHLYSCLKQQPTMIISPSILKESNTIILKMWSWGLGERLAYPVGFEFGRINIGILHEQTIYEETLKMIKLSQSNQLGNFNMYESFSPKLKENISIVKLMHENKLKGDIANFFLKKLVSAQSITPEIDRDVERRKIEKISSVFCCMASMYADAYHLLEHKTTPILPALLPMLPGSDAFSLQLQRHYSILLDRFQQKEINKELVANIYVDVVEAFFNPKIDILKEKELLENAQSFLTEHEDRMSKQNYSRLRNRLNQSTNNIVKSTKEE